VNQDLCLEPRRKHPIGPARRYTEHISRRFEMNADPFECAP